MKSYAAFMVLFFMAITAFAATGPDTLWTHNYGGGDDDWVQMILPTADGGWALAGNTTSFGSGKTDYYLVKINGDGKVEWSKTYGGGDEDVLGGARITHDGGFILAGCTESLRSGSSKDTLWAPYLVRTDARGDTLWTRRFSFDLGAIGQDVVQTSEGHFAVAGRRETKTSSLNAFLMMVDSTGQMLWSKDYGGIAWDEAENIELTTDGGFILAGRTSSMGKGKWDMYVIKTDSQGDTLWVRTYGGTDIDRAHDVQQTPDGGYIIVGETGYFGDRNHGIFVVKTDARGVVQWAHAYGKARDQGKAVINMPDGGYAVAGVTRSKHGDEADMYLLRLNASGNLLWERAYGGSDWDAAEDVACTPKGGFILAGANKSVSPHNLDFYVVRTKPE